MILQGMIPSISRARTFEAALRYAQRSADFSLVDGLRAPLLAGLLDARRGPQCLFVIVATGRDSESLRAALPSVMPDAEIIEFPAWETLPHERLSPSAETVGKRIHALRRLQAWQADVDAAATAPPTRTRDTPPPVRDIVVVASVRAALQPLSDNLTSLDPLCLRMGGRGYNLAELSTRLVDLAYSRVDMVTRRGEFAVRGGILDVFAPDAEHPVRAEFFGDELEQLKPFSVADQRSLPEVLAQAELPASREMLLSPEVRQRAREMQHEFPSLAQMLAKIAEGIPVDGMESLAPALVDRLVPITHYLPADAAIAVLSPERVASRALSLVETNREFLAAAWNAATVGAEAPIDLDSGNFLSVPDLHFAAGSRAWWTMSGFDTGAAEPVDPTADISTADISDLVEDAGEYVRIAADSVPSFAGQVDGAIAHVGERIAAGWTVLVVAQGAGLVERAAEALGEHGLAGRVVDDFPEHPDAGVAYLVKASVEKGFELPDARFAVISESEFYGRSAGYDTRQVKKLASRRKNVVDPLQLTTGDIVVHNTHGIGRFLELVQREVSTGGRPLKGSGAAPKVSREYLAIEYAPSKRGFPGDKLYVPTDQLDLLTRYVGGDAPTLSKMGGSDWSSAKSKARKAVRDIAVELVKLYSARMASKGHAFPPDTPWQRELEEAFPFAETPDQLTTIDEVKADMERPIPMDRLISGDVGYGKTEIAIRAAFKAVQDGKQVIMLVPTTLLVRQHMETFAERFAGFPVHL
ncbi:MAG: DEAD/DEAH box helicase, partial [Burkholderiaceae bacterium]|nr:DEAD/DEAH box helicase [Microbacteriaceae bacterium]